MSQRTTLEKTPVAHDFKLSGEPDKVALYLRVAHSMRSRINDGEWPANTQLPTIVQLAAEYDVALVTIRQAVALLAADKLVVSTRGRGTFVKADVVPMRENTSLKAAINDRLDLPANFSIKVLERKKSKTLPKQFLNAAEEQYPEYMIVKKLHLEGGEPFSLIHVGVASHIYANFPRNAEAKRKIFRILLDMGELDLQSSRIEMMLTYADQTMAALLQCPALSVLVRIRSVRIDEAGKIAVATDSYYRGDRFIYELEERSVSLGSTSSLAVPNSRRAQG